MKFNSKRIFSIIFVLVLVLGMAGCKNDAKDNHATNSKYNSSKNHSNISTEVSNGQDETAEDETLSDEKESPEEKESSSKKKGSSSSKKKDSSSSKKKDSSSSKKNSATSSEKNSITSSEKNTATSSKKPSSTSSKKPSLTSSNDSSKNETATKEFVPVLRFVVASDVHITNTTNVNAKRLEKLFDCSFRYASKSEKYNKMDAFVFVGDFTDNGLIEEYSAFNSIVSRATENKKTKVICSMGNHEYYKGSSLNFLNMTGNSLNEDITINGFHFITMSPEKGSGAYNSNTLSWLKSAVRNAAGEDPEKPIFTFQHHHLKDTVYVSDGDWQTSSSDEIKKIFNNYSQVINFSGHSHAPINIPTSIWQGNFTALGTGTLNFFELCQGITDGPFPEGKEDAAQFYIVEVDKNNKVKILPYNLLTDDFFSTPSNCDDEDEKLVYEIEKPSDSGTFIYDDREETATAPYFKSGAKVEIINTDSSSVQIKVPAAYDEACLHNYEMVCKSGNGDVVEYSAFYDFYREPMPKNMTYKIHGLEEATNYTLTVYPVNCYGIRGNSITTTFKTKSALKYTYSSINPVNFLGTFTNFDSMSSIIRSNNSFSYGGNIGGDIFHGGWDNNNSYSSAKFALDSNKGYNNSKALEVWSEDTDNKGLYIFGTTNNKFTTQYPANDYLRVWVDFTNVEFRKMNFGLVSKTGGIFTTDMGDNRNDQAFYYLPEGSDTWQSFVHGDDGCFGDAQKTPVNGFKGWMAFPVKDFLYKSGTGTDGLANGTPFSGYEFAGVYIFWDYSDHKSQYKGNSFYLDEIQLVKDYKVFEKY